MNRRDELEELDEELARQVSLMGLGLGGPQRRAAVEYLMAMLDANRSVNLTSITDPLTALRLHVADSLSALPELDSAPAGPAVDLGSGGGFPGVPLAIASGRAFTLIDSVSKKGSAVAAVLRDLDIASSAVNVVSERAEEFALHAARRFAAVVARAVAPLPALVELSSPLLRDGGVLIALKGRPDITEREAGARVAAIVGMSERGWRTFTLPGGEARTIATYVRDHPTSVRLPRRIGLAQNCPLA